MQNVSEFKVKAGGKKGERIIQVIADDKDKAMTRRQVAEAAGCTVGRVGEVVRYLTATGDEETKAMVSHLAGKTGEIVNKAKAEAAPSKPKGKATPRKRAARKTTAKAKAAK